MRTKDQVCTFEQANKLKKLGIKQESLFYHFLSEENDIAIVSCDIVEFIKVGTLFSAFTVSELGEMLPNILPDEYSDYGKVLMQIFPDGKTQKEYATEYVSINGELDYGATIFSEEGRTEAESRAAMLIFLLEKGIVKVEDINVTYNKLTYD